MIEFLQTLAGGALGAIMGNVAITIVVVFSKRNRRRA